MNVIAKLICYTYSAHICVMSATSHIPQEWDTQATINASSGSGKHTMSALFCFSSKLQ